ncbi:MAG: 2TM domain-containing protein [Solirubrobacterales bacterium]
MNDDPFARAVERVQAAEQAEKDAKREKRQRQLESGSRTAFNIHATVFVAVNALIIVIWATVWQLNDGTSYPWFVFVLFGWGIGLAAHFAAVRNHLRRR